MAGKPDEQARSNKTSGDSGPPVNVTTGGWSEGRPSLRRKSFPGPAGVTEPLRVAMTRDAYGEVTGHAKESLNAEICGVLVGELCEDDSGPFVFVEAAIRGTAAKKGATHVTFTQETWAQIHQQMEQNHRKRQMVGWYHTHPGFGVEFSEMDLFVQRNFFAGAGQIAYVTDPLGGEEAILVNSGGKVAPIGRFWVEGRERQCKTPPGHQNGGRESADDEPPSVGKALSALDERVSQLMQMVDAQAASMYRFLLAMAMLVAIGVALFLAYEIYSGYAYQNRPPELQSFVPVPVQIGDKSVLLGVGVVKWDVPASLNSAFIQVERERQAADEAARKAAAATQPAQTQTTTATTTPAR